MWYLHEICLTPTLTSFCTILSNRVFGLIGTLGVCSRYAAFSPFESNPAVFSSLVHYVHAGENTESGVVQKNQSERTSVRCSRHIFVVVVSLSYVQ